MKKPLVVALLAAALLVGSGGPVFTGNAHAASRTQTHAHIFDKTRFLLHMGAAFYAFHHWIYSPYKQHAFDSGAPHRTKDLIKAGIAALFAAHEVHVAYGIAKGSKSKTLQLLIAPISKFESTLSTAGTDFKSGKFSSAAVNSMTGSASYIGSTASKGGYTIKDIATHIPGL